MVLVGFWPTYFGQILSGGTPNRHWVVHLHGWIFVGWMALLLTQVILAATGRIRAHRSLGTIGIAYGFLVLAMGLIVSVASPVIHVAAGNQTMDEAAGFLIVPLGDMVMFGGFFIPAVIYRSRPEVHKRLILLATAVLLFAAVGRMQSYMPFLLAILLWFSPVLVGIAYDAWTRRKVHRVYFIGLVVMVIGISRLALMGNEVWLRIGRSLIRAFA